MFTRNLLFFTAVFSLYVLLVPRPESHAGDISKLTFQPLEFAPPKTERVTLDNGMVLHLYEDHELPIISVTAFFRSGSVYEPAGKEGLASLTSTLMRTGGTKGRTVEEIDETLEYIAANADVDMEYDKGEASLTVLKKDIDIGLDVWADMIMNPNFPKEKIEIEKNKEIESIRRENDSPHGVVSREFSKIVFRGSQQGLFPTIETVTSISREDLVNFHQRFLAPNNLMLGITGDFDRDVIIKKLNKVFAGWKRKEVDLSNPPPSFEKFKPSVNYIFKDNTQSVIRLGHLGIKKRNPDYFAVKVLSHILGSGGFTSRLMKEVRSDRGLAYSVWSHFVPGYSEPGLFVAGLATKSETTAEALSLVLETIKGITEAPVSDLELSVAKESTINSFVFAFTTPVQVVRNRMRLEYYNLDSNYLETFRNKVEKVTKEDVLRVAKKYLHNNGMTIVVVGNRDKFDRPLKEFGAVETVTLKKFD